MFAGAAVGQPRRGMTILCEKGNRMEKDRVEAVHRIEITGSLDRHSAEALQIEIRRLAKRHGIAIKTMRLARVQRSHSAKRA